MHENTSQTSIKDVMRLHDIDEVDLEVVRKYGALVMPRMSDTLLIFMNGCVSCQSTKH